LGYLSVTVADPPFGNGWSLGIGGVVLFLMGMMTAQKYWRLSRLRCIAGIVFAFFGLASVASVTVLSGTLGWWKYLNPQSGTITKMSIVSSRLAEFRKKYGDGPTDIAAFKREYKVSDRDLQDGWKREMRIGRIIADGHVFYSVISLRKTSKDAESVTWSSASNQPSHDRIRTLRIEP
jgi:hypothetical protein